MARREGRWGEERGEERGDGERREVAERFR